MKHHFKSLDNAIILKHPVYPICQCRYFFLIIINMIPRIIMLFKFYINTLYCLNIIQSIMVKHYFTRFLAWLFWSYRTLKSNAFYVYHYNNFFNLIQAPKWDFTCSTHFLLWFCQSKYFRLDCYLLLKTDCKYNCNVIFSTYSKCCS